MSQGLRKLIVFIAAIIFWVLYLNQVKDKKIDYVSFAKIEISQSIPV